MDLSFLNDPTFDADQDPRIDPRLAARLRALRLGMGDASAIQPPPGASPQMQAPQVPSRPMPQMQAPQMQAPQVPSRPMPQIQAPQMQAPQMQGAPDPIDELRKRAMGFSTQATDLMAKPTDASGYQDYARQRSGEGNNALLLAMAAQRAGKEFAPLGGQFLQRAMAARQPLGMKSGMVTPEGDYLEDPTFAREQRIAMLTAQAQKYDQMAQNSADLRQRAEATTEAARLRAEALAETRADRRDRGREAAASKDERSNWRFEDSLSKQFDAQIKLPTEELSATQKVRQLAPGLLGRRPNAVEQQSLMVLLNKFLDPGSVVREGEFDRVARAQGMVGQASNLLNRIGKGELLGDKLIGQIVQMSELYEKAANFKIQQIGDQFQAKAQKRGFDPSAVTVSPFYSAPSRGTAGPPPGAVQRLD